MSKYPSPEERDRIVARRKQLSRELIAGMMAENERQRDRTFTRLAHRYGQAEVERVQRILARRLTPRNLKDDDRILYEEYLDYYRRFGGRLTFLTAKEYARLNEEFSILFGRKQIGRTLTGAEQERLTTLTATLLKDAPYWEDLVPEDPPQQAPKVDLISGKQEVSITVPAHPKPAAPPTCPRDGFPMVTINGKPECSVEFIDRCVGGQTVVDVVRQNQTTWYVFENGHQLPLLCFCCGKPLVSRDIEQEKKQLRGRKLKSMSIGVDVAEDGREQEGLNLEFSKIGFFSRGYDMTVSFQVAAQMRHPADCPYRKRLRTAKKK